MWLSEKKTQREVEGTAQIGVTTLGGNPAGVYLAGERRNLPVMGPRGYQWTPMTGEQVLVIKAGDQGEMPCVVGVQMEGSLEPGAVRITNGDETATIVLSADGTISLTGTVLINGKTVVTEEGSGT